MSATVAAAVKAAIVILSNEEARKKVGWGIVAILSPLIVLVVLLCAILSGTSQHNVSAVELCFHGGSISASATPEYQRYIEDMRNSFDQLDEVIAEINSQCEDGKSLDDTRVKAIFYALFFGADQPGMNDEDYRTFADCFVTYEERQDEDGNTYTVAVPITNLETIYSNLESVLNRVITPEDKSNAQRIYTQAKYGSAGGGEGGNGLPPGIAMGDGSFKALMEEATKYIGWPYVWGGSSPSTSFDCSGYVCWVYTQSGVYNLPRTTAQGIFDQCSVVSREEAKPGDLIFFTGTYASGSPVSHIGIYVGENQMLHCGDPIGYANIDSAYWSSHFYAMGRLPG